MLYKESLMIMPSQIALSTVTKKPYIGSEREGYIFLHADSVMRFKDAAKDTATISPLTTKQYEDYVKELIPMGFQKLICDMDYEHPIPLTTHGSAKNTKTPAGLLLFAETKRIEHFKYALDGTSIVPAGVIENKLTYATAQNKGKSFTLVFSTIEEYKKWENAAKGVSENYAPLEMRTKAIVRVSGNTPVIFDIASTGIILSETLKRAIEEA